MLLFNKGCFNALKKPEVLKCLKIICLILVCLLGFFYGLYYAENWNKFSEYYGHDEGNYISMAKRILETGVYSYWGEGPDAYVTPGFPMFLVICMSVFGTGLQGLHYIKIVQCVMMGLSILLVFLLGYMVTKRYSVGIIASLLIALNGIFYYYSRFLITETLFVFTSLLFLVAIIYTMQKNKWWLYLISGILLSITTMVRPLIIILFPFVVLAEIIRKRKDYKAWLINIGLFVLGFIVVAAPWWIRNVVTLGEFIPLATQTNPIYAGLAPDISALGIENPRSLIGNVILLFKLLIKDPISTINWMTIGKFSIIFLSSEGLPYFSELTNAIVLITVVLGSFGLLRGLFSKKLRYLAIVFLIYMLSILMFVPTSRYAIGYYPVLAVAAGYLLDKAFRKLKD